MPNASVLSGEVGRPNSNKVETVWAGREGAREKKSDRERERERERERAREIVSFHLQCAHSFACSMNSSST
jgi:hypothetical protein